MIAEGLACAKKEGKQVLLLLGASWCVPCHLTEAALRGLKYMSILGKQSTLPDYAILDADGKIRANFRVDNHGQQIHVFPQQGYPFIGAYLRMLHDATPKFSLEDFKALRKVLEEDDKDSKPGLPGKMGSSSGGELNSPPHKEQDYDKKSHTSR